MGAVESSGAQTATLTTEHTLASPSTNKTRMLGVDASALVAGETLTLRIKKKYTSGGTDRLTREAVYTGPLAEPGIDSMPVRMPYGGSFTLTQTGGTGRSYDWHIDTLD